MTRPSTIWDALEHIEFMSANPTVGPVSMRLQSQLSANELAPTPLFRFLVTPASRQSNEGGEWALLRAESAPPGRPHSPAIGPTPDECIGDDKGMAVSPKSPAWSMRSLLLASAAGAPGTKRIGDEQLQAVRGLGALPLPEAVPSGRPRGIAASMGIRVAWSQRRLTRGGDRSVHRHPMPQGRGYSAIRRLASGPVTESQVHDPHDERAIARTTNSARIDPAAFSSPYGGLHSAKQYNARKGACDSCPPGADS